MKNILLLSFLFGLNTVFANECVVKVDPVIDDYSYNQNFYNWYAMPAQDKIIETLSEIGCKYTQNKDKANHIVLFQLSDLKEISVTAPSPCSRYSAKYTATLFSSKSQARLKSISVKVSGLEEACSGSLVEKIKKSGPRLLKRVLENVNDQNYDDYIVE